MYQILNVIKQFQRVRDQCNDQRWVITCFIPSTKIMQGVYKNRVQFQKKMASKIADWSNKKSTVWNYLYQQLVILHCVFISGISLREVSEAIHTSPRFETSTAEKTFTTISYQRREGAEPNFTPIIAAPEMTLNDSLPAANTIQFSRTYYLVKLITYFHNSWI